jgi:hypothetical protein
MLLPALLVVAAVQDTGADALLVTHETVDAIVSHVVPAPDELEWRTIPWRPTLFDGLRDGAAEKKPVLLWAMNGHPLGST